METESLVPLDSPIRETIVKAWHNPKTRLVLILSLISAVVLVVVIPLAFVAGRFDHGAASSDEVPGGGYAFFAETAVVAADHPTCSTIGKEILFVGGHAVDAAVATAFCQGVMNPFASGIGGGGIMLIYTNHGNATDPDLAAEYIDMRETAPAAARQDMYYEDPNEAIVGPRAVGVPGEVHGMYIAWHRYGRIAWDTLVEPAAKLAEGFPVGPQLALNIVNSETKILNNPELAAVYAPNGVLLKEGDTCRNPKLAATLHTIGTEGPLALYNGTLGQQLAKDVQEAGGILTFEDLQNYRIVYREPIDIFFMGYRVLLPPPPYSGAVIAMVMNIIERYNLAEMGYTVEALHYLIEALKFGFSDRMTLGDPAFVNLTKILPTMLDKNHAAVLRQRINDTHAFPAPYYIDLTSEIINFTDHGTSHLSVVDAERNAVSFTTTINYGFGSTFVSPSTGILLNDEMDDFSVSNQSNVWGLPPSYSNVVAPGKRPLSSMSASMIFRDNKLFMVAGGSGGPLIITETLQTYLNVILFGRDLYEAVNGPRFHTNFPPPILRVEEDFPKDLVEGLQEKGNEVVIVPYLQSAVQAILVQEDNTLLAACDKRKRGLPDGF